MKQGLTPAAICRLCAIATTTFYRYLPEYRAGGIEKRKAIPLPRRRRQLAD